MMQTVPKWKVIVTLADADHSEVVLWIHDNFIGNVLRQIAAMQFTESGLEQPRSIVVTKGTDA